MCDSPASPSTPIEPAKAMARLAHGFDDERRIRILLALQDGRALSATHLAIEAGIAPSTTSAHLKLLLDAGLIRQVPSPPHHGKHRSFTLAGPDVAAICESLAAMTSTPALRSLQPGTPEARMRAARSCYDHLAGRLAVQLLDAMLAADLLVPSDAGYAVTTQGDETLGRFGIDIPQLRSSRRPFIGVCTDWSEQRPHLSGGLGKALLDQIVLRGWVVRSVGDRTLAITNAGEHGLRSWFGLDTGAIETLNGIADRSA